MIRLAQRARTAFVPAATLVTLLALPGLALADAAPSPPQFEDCTGSYREKGDTSCVECNPYSEGDDDSAQLVTCDDQMTATDYFYVCTQDVRFALNATEVWCDGPHKADCACSLDATVTPWPAALLVALGLLALRFRRHR